MAFWRPFRRPNRNLGTLGGNPSELDAVNAEGPPVFPGPGGLVGGFLYWENAERPAAVEADLERDVNSDFANLTDDENQAWDSLAESNEQLAKQPDD